MTSRFDTLIHRLKTGVSTVELVYVPHERWPLPLASEVTTLPRDGSSTSPLRVSVLDSSFNPPTLAHRALASVPMPSSLLQKDHEGQPDVPEPSDFHAQLLLLSVRNADKALKPTDATYEERMEMMVLLAKDIIAGGEPPARQTTRNIAVGIIDEPTFVGKSRILREFLQRRISSLCVSASHSSMDLETLAPRPCQCPGATGPSAVQPITTTPSGEVHTASPQLTFVVGIDTLERIVSPRYYASDESMRRSLHQFLGPDGDDSYLICAQRATPGLSISHDERERDALDIARQYIDPRRVDMVNIGKELEACSSSEVRERIGSGDELWRQMVPMAIADYVTAKGLYTVDRCKGTTGQTVA